MESIQQIATILFGLAILHQAWWLQPLLEGRSDAMLFWGATSLTALTDNAALT